MPKWFGPKRIGSGYRPASVMGWLLTALFIGLLALWKHSGRPTIGLPLLSVPVVLVLAYVLIAYFTSRPAASKNKE